jgi:hypothetical protein
MKTWLRKVLGIERRKQERQISDMISTYIDPVKLARLVEEKEAEEKAGKTRVSRSDGAKL